MRILITGANSYIGTSFDKYMKSFPTYTIDTIDMIDDHWESVDFSRYDTVFHVAGIAHSDAGKLSQDKIDLYYRVNTELAEQTAMKAKNDGVRQFIYMSSMIVYGGSAPIGQQKIITKDTKPQPMNAYGDSKLQAENKLLPMQSENFNVVILRPPMIYGKGSKGNYPTLSKYAKKLPIFPDVDNQRSMLYIENLCEFVRLMIQNQEVGIFMPQNAEYTKTSEMVRQIAKIANKSIKSTCVFNPILKLLAPKFHVIKQAFGNLTYDQTLSQYTQNYRVVSLSKSIELTENEGN